MVLSTVSSRRLNTWVHDVGAQRLRGKPEGGLYHFAGHAWIGIQANLTLLAHRLAIDQVERCDTIGHPSLLGLRDPTVLGIVWGIIATWWVGLALGLLLALACRHGTRPTLTVRDVRRPIVAVMLGVGLTSLIAGLAGYTLARTGSLYMPYTLVTRVPTDRQLVAARQPRAAGVFLIVCLILGGVGAAILLGTIADIGIVSDRSCARPRHRDDLRGLAAAPATACQCTATLMRVPLAAGDTFSRSGPTAGVTRRQPPTPEVKVVRTSLAYSGHGS
jgi:hypothetical protein